MPLFRKLLSQILNLFFRIGLSLPINDLSSGFRLYRGDIIKSLKLESKNFEVQEEILIKIYMQGFNIEEIPFTYYPRKNGSSHARVFAFGVCLLKTFFKMRKLRNSTESADYEQRAFYSLFPPQRYWNRKRYEIVFSMAQKHDRVLDIGCGSGMILLSLDNVIGLDIMANKLRYMQRRGCTLINGCISRLPFQDKSFDCVVCSEVIEHVVPRDEVFREINRVLKPGGALVLGTPDYDTIGWRIIEPLYGFFLPHGYKDSHITRYSKNSLKQILSKHSFDIKEMKYILRSDLFVECKKQN